MDVVVRSLLALIFFSFSLSVRFDRRDIIPVRPHDVGGFGSFR